MIWGVMHKDILQFMISKAFWYYWFYVVKKLMVRDEPFYSYPKYLYQIKVKKGRIKYFIYKLI